MVSLPGPETALIGAGSQLPAGSEKSLEQSFLTQSSGKLVEDKSPQEIVGTPLNARRRWPNRPTSLSLRLSARKNKVEQGGGDMSPFQQRHGIHGLPSMDTEVEGQHKRTGLSRSQSMNKPSKPTTPKPYKNGGSLKDLRFRFSQQNIYQLSVKSTSKQGDINEISETGSLVDLRAPKNNNWKRHSITSVNSEKLDHGIFFEPRTKCRAIVRKRSRPLSEVANSGRTVAAIPEHGVLLDTSKEKNNNDCINNKAHSPQPPSPMEINLGGDEIINKETSYEATQDGSGDGTKRPEDTDELHCVELPSINRIKRRTDVTFEEHECKRRLRYGVLSASYCDEGSLEDVSLIYEMNNTHNLPRPMSVIDGMDVLRMEPDLHNNSAMHFSVGLSHHESRIISALDMNSSLSIPAGLDRIQNNTFILDPTNSGITVENGIPMVPWSSSLSEAMEVGDPFTTIEENDANGMPLVILNPSKPIFVEALWDHVTMDEEELCFRVGDVILVKNMSDAVWWWGELENAEGWFPASFVRVLVNQRLRKDSEDESGSYDENHENKSTSVDSLNNRCNKCGLLKKDVLGEQVSDRTCSCQSTYDTASSDISMTSASPESHLTPSRNANSTKWNQMRANVVKEILSSERDFVKHLKDVVEGYVNRCKKRPDMFPDDCVKAVFSNIEIIYDFQRKFLSQLEDIFNRDHPHESDIGSVFLNNKDEFEIYSEYCNNHPKAMTMLMDLSGSKKYRHFFEACRLLQRMIDISIDGFLLTPVQKICKYPLQLAELLKYTKEDDPNHENVKAALNAMKDVARMINDRKRQIENIEKITVWQKNIINWQDEDVLERSSELIHSGEFYAMFFPKSKPQLRVGFLFDHQLILCKKDLLRKDLLYYKYRFDLRDCDVIESDDVISRDWVSSSSSVGTISWKNWWKIQSRSSPLCVVMFCKKEDDKRKWMRAFEKEKKLAEDEDRRRMSIPDDVKKEIVDKTTLRCQTEKDNTRMSLHVTYRQRMKMIQRARNSKNSMFSSADRNSPSNFLSNFAIKLTPFRKNSTSQTQPDAKIPTL